MHTDWCLNLRKYVQWHLTPRGGKVFSTVLISYLKDTSPDRNNTLEPYSFKYQTEWLQWVTCHAPSYYNSNRCVWLSLLVPPLLIHNVDLNTLWLLLVNGSNILIPLQGLTQVEEMLSMVCCQSCPSIACFMVNMPTVDMWWHET